MIFKAKYVQYIPELIANEYKKSTHNIIDALKSLIEKEEILEEEAAYDGREVDPTQFETPSFETVVIASAITSDGTPITLTNHHPYTEFFLEDLHYYSGGYMESPFRIPSPYFVLAPTSFYKDNDIKNLHPSEMVAINNVVVLQYVTPEQGQEEVWLYVDVLSPTELPHTLPYYYTSSLDRKWNVQVCKDAGLSYPHLNLRGVELSVYDDELEREVWDMSSTTDVCVCEGLSYVDVRQWRLENDE